MSFYKKAYGFERKSFAAGRKFSAAKFTAGVIAALVLAHPALNTYAAYSVYPDRDEETPPAVGSYVNTSHGVSPRTDSEWALLEDDFLGWDEIPSLIHEYNAAVITNRAALSSDERRSMDAEELSEYLSSLASDYEQNAIEIEDTSALLSATYMSTANSLRQQAASNLDDFEIIKLGYELAEKELVLAAREQMVEYYRAADAISANEYYVNYLSYLLNLVEARKKAGTATGLDELEARENLLEASGESISLKAARDNIYMNLIVSCGWAYDAEAEIGPLPELNREEIAAIDYENSFNLAEENSISLKIDRVRLENARAIGSSSDIDTAETTLETDEASFYVNFRAAYDSLISADSTYETLLSSRDHLAAEYAALSRQYELGLVSESELRAGEYSLKTAELNAQSALYDLLEARAVFDAAVENGVL